MKVLVFFHEKLLACFLNLQELHWLLFPASDKSLMQSCTWFAVACASKDFPRHCGSSSRTLRFCKPIQTAKAFNFTQLQSRRGPMNTIWQPGEGDNALLTFFGISCHKWKKQKGKAATRSSGRRGMGTQ